MKLDIYFILYTKINSKWIKDLTIRAKTIRLSEENIGINLHDLRLGICFLNMTPDVQTQNSFIKIKNVCVSKDTIKKMKREPTE